MKSKVLILSHPKLTQVLQEVLKDMNQLPEVTIKDVSFGGVINFLTNHLHSIRPNMIITGGAHWEMLNNSDYEPNVPIIPIPVTRFDLLQAALQAKQYGKKIAVIHYGEKLREYYNVVEDIDCEIQFFSYNSKEEVISILSSLKKSGIDAVIGAGLVCSITEKFNLPSVFLHSKDSIIKIMEHVARLEMSRLEVAKITQKWAMEFMEYPILNYEGQSHSEKLNSFSLLSNKNRNNETKEEKMIVLEQFLFNKRISSFFTKDNFVTNVNPFFDELYPYVSFGAFSCKEGKAHLLSMWEKIESEKEGRVFYSFKGEDCHLVLLTQKEVTSGFLTHLSTTPPHVFGGISTSILNEDLFSSDDTLAQKIYEAQIALELSKLGSIPSTICLLEPSSTYSMLFKLIQHSELPETKLLTPLFGHRNTDKLLYTLRLLLDHGLSITAVANHLGISRQTVYTLMERIENLVGLLTNPEKRLTLSLELRILDMKKAVEQIEASTKSIDQAYSIV